MFVRTVWRGASHKMQEEHDAAHRGERAYAEDFWFRGEMKPDQVTALSMDAPTETQFDVPVQQRSARDPVKSLENAKKWASKITGIMVSGFGMLAFVTRAGLGSGPNLSCSVLYLTLLLMVAQGRVLGNKFHLLVDGTGADNKNNELIFFLAWLVESDVFDEASFFCMIVGHTFCRIDQSFRTLIVKLLSVPVWTVSALLGHIRRFLQPYGCIEVRELHCLWDFKAWFAPCVHQRLSGFATGQYGSGMHEFLLRKDENGKARLWLRKSSQAGWLPEGQGYLVFREFPTGQPALAKGKADHEWRKDTVISTVRAWFQVMHLNLGELARVKQDWQARFDALPPDGDTNQLAESYKPAWLPLPTRAACVLGERRSSLGQLSAHVAPSSGLENPLVNPVVGEGRTEADVAYEREAVKRRMRSLYDSCIFQADYIFVKASQSSVGAELQRVANGIILDDANASDISLTTQRYEHVPQDGFAGFFGHFRLAPNPAHDPANKKTGLKFLRETNVARADILVYNVQTFTTDAPSDADVKKELRVKLESVRALAAQLGQPPIDDSSVPPSHGGSDGAPAARGGGRAARGGGRAARGGRRAARGRAVASEEAEDEDEDPEAEKRSDADPSDGDASNGEEQQGEETEDDPLPPIPSGYQELSVRKPFQEFLLWTEVDGQDAAWHRFVVLKVWMHTSSPFAYACCVCTHVCKGLAC